MEKKIERIKFSEDLLLAKKFLIINRFLLLNISIFRKFALVVSLIYRGLLTSIFFPIFWTIIPATINWTGQEWVYGIFLIGATAGYIYTKFVQNDKGNLFDNIISTINNAQTMRKRKNKDFSLVDSKWYKKSKKNREKELSEASSKICEGFYRNEAKFSWLEPVTGVVIFLYFLNNSNITIVSEEYRNLLISISFVTFDLVLGGFFGSFDFLTSWIPEINTNGELYNTILVGFIKFFIVLFFSKLIVEGFKSAFSGKIWFDGNYIALNHYLSKNFGDMIDHEGTIMVYDFGTRQQFGSQQCIFVPNKEIKEKNEEIIRGLLNANVDKLKDEREIVNTDDPEFYENEIHFFLENTNYFEYSEVGINIGIEDEMPSLFYTKQLILDQVKELKYDADLQKFYFILEDERELDTGVVALYPMSIIFETSDKIILRERSFSEDRNLEIFDLNVVGNGLTNGNKLMRNTIVKLRKMRQR